MLQDHKLDKSTPIPLYYQLKTMILGEIQNGSYPSGSMIPTEIEISELFDISRTTVRQAIAELVTEGYLYRIKSKGTFVSKPKVEQHLLSPVYRYQDSISEGGAKARQEVIRMEVIPMPPELIRLGAGTEKDRAIYLYRKWCADDDVLERVITYLPYNKFKFLLNEQIAQLPLHDIMDQRPETRVHRLIRSCEAIPASSEDISVLGVAPGSAIQKLTTERYNKQEELLDLSYAYYRGDMNKIRFELIQPD